MKINKLILVLMVAIMLFSMAAAPSTALAASSACTKEHTVKRGETLNQIADKYDVKRGWLMEVNGISDPASIKVGQKLCVAYKANAGQTAGASNVTIQVVDVEEDAEVTIKARNLPAGERYTVRMGRMGTQGLNGYRVGTLNSGNGGTITATFDIPVQLRDRKQVVIRLESRSTGAGVYNWFNNYTWDQSSSDDDDEDNAGQISDLEFNIVDVVEDDSVSIRGNGFPANTRFTVLMGRMGTKGRGGVRAGSLTTNNNGNFRAVFDIPEEMRDRSQVAIRLESASGLVAYNWFKNATTGD